MAWIILDLLSNWKRMKKNNPFHKISPFLFLFPNNTEATLYREENQTERLTVIKAPLTPPPLPECDIRMDFDTNEYLNIFVSRKWHKRISEYIRMNIFYTNEYLNIFVLKFRYERITE